MKRALQLFLFSIIALIVNAQDSTALLKKFTISGYIKDLQTLSFDKYFKELIHVGLPMGFMHVIEICAFTIMTFWIARFGTTTLAAHQIV